MGSILQTSPSHLPRETTELLEPPVRMVPPVRGRSWDPDPPVEMACLDDLDLGETPECRDLPDPLETPEWMECPEMGLTDDPEPLDTEATLAGTDPPEPEERGERTELLVPRLPQ